MKFNLEKKHISLGITAFLVIAASICFYYLMFHGDRFSAKINSLAVIASPVLYGIVLAYLLTPLVNYLENRYLIALFTKSSKMTIKKHKWMRFISIFITLVFVIFLIYAFFSSMIPDLITSIKNISIAFPTYVNNLTHYADKYLKANPDIDLLFKQLLNTYSDEFNQYLNNNIIPQMESLVKTVSLSLIGVLKAMWNFIIGLIISVYVLFSKETFAAQSKKLIYAIFPTSTANQFLRDCRFTSDTFLGFISGKLIDSVIIGIICYIGTMILRLPYPLLISVIVGVTNIIPFFGPYLGAIPSAILILMIDPLKCVTFIIFIIILQQVDGNFIGPKILGQSTGLSSFWVIFSITIFGGLLGIPGMIVGVPCFAVIYALIKRIIDKRLIKKGFSVKTTDYQDLEYIDTEKNHAFITKDKKEEKRFFKISPKKQSSPDKIREKEEKRGE